MPRTCKLCASLKRNRIDTFIAHDGTYKDFCRKFRLKVSRWQFARHQHHIIERPVNTPDPSVDVANLVNSQFLSRMNRKLLVLAARAERVGKPMGAIAAYKVVSSNLEMLARFAKADADAKPATLPAAPALPAGTNVDAELMKLLLEWASTPDGAEFLKFVLVKAGHKEVLLLASWTNEELLRQLRNHDLRERLRTLIIESEARLDQVEPSSYFIYPPNGEITEDPIKP